MQVKQARWSFAAILCGALVSLTAAGAHAQSPMLTPMAGWQWGGTLDFVSGDVHINAAPNYGGALSVPVRPGMLAELSYSYQNAEVVGRPNGSGGDFHLFDLGTHYMQACGLRLAGRPGSKATPFVMGGLGATVFAPGNSDFGQFDTQWLFSMTMGGGVMVAMNERVALRLQARFLLPINWVSGGAYFGTGGGGLTVSGGSALPQGDASVGLTFKLGQ